MKKEAVVIGARVAINTFGTYPRYDHKVGTISRVAIGNTDPHYPSISVGYQHVDSDGWPSIYETVTFSFPNVWEMFSLVSDETVQFAITAQNASVPVSKQVEDWRLWRDDKPGFCPCGIVKQDCSYHKS